MARKDVPFDIRRRERALNKEERIQQMMDQVHSFREGLHTAEQLYPVEMKKIPGEFNFLVSTKNASCALVSRYDIERQMEHMFASVDKEVNFLIVFGISLGHALDYARRNYKKLKRIMIVDPSGEIVYRMLGIHEVMAYISQAGLIDFNSNQDPDLVAQGLQTIFSENMEYKIGFAANLPYLSLFPGYFERVQERFVQLIQETQVSVTTGSNNVFLRMQNITSNMGAAGVDIRALLDRLPGLPALMVSAGPSLDKNIHLLEEAKKRVLVIAVGSSIKILYNKGILPHLRAAFSPLPDDNMVFDGIEDFQGIPLIFSNTLDYLVLKRYDAPRGRMVMLGDLLSRYVYELAHIPHTLVAGGGTIANVTLDLLCRHGAEPVILTGQDLCYTDDRLYADGSWGDLRATPDGLGMYPEVDIYGNQVWTSKIFLGIRRNFEDIIASHPSAKVINATEGGVKLAGTSNMTLQEVLDGLPERPVGEMVNDIFAHAASATPDIDGAVQHIKMEIDQIKSVNQERVDRIRAILENASDMYEVVQSLREVAQTEQQLRTIPFYANVILSEINALYYAIEKANHYNGANLERQAETLMKTQIGYATRLAELCDFINEQLRRNGW